VLLVIVALAIVRIRDLFAAAMLFAIYSLLSAGLFAALDAGDVALTEAAVGAGISTLLILGVLTVARRHEKVVSGHNVLALVVVFVTGAALIFASLDLPEFGHADNPVHQHVGPYYIEQSYPDMGVPNMVAAVLASYRSIDTIGEAFVILTAGLGVFALLSVRPRRRPVADPEEDDESEARK
jgi:multicomponent Na+:H+ antiporter subunit B